MLLSRHRFPWAAVTRAALAAATFVTMAAVGAQAQGSAGDDPLPFDPAPPIAPALARVAAITDLGRAIFRDPSLSASGRVACASCHDPSRAFGPPDGAAVRLGGPNLDQPGTRAVPNLTYAQFSPFFDEHHHEEEADEGLDAGPTGGRTWDGRGSRARDQAKIPLLAPNEMANPSSEAVVAKAAAASWSEDVRRLYGKTIFDDPARAFAAIAEALEVYQEYPPEFSPFTSKYDAWLHGQAELTPAEKRGLEAFNDPARGNCAHCHSSRMTAHGAAPLFTDFGLVAAAPPRNREIPANADPAYFDLGLCGPFRLDFGNNK